MVETEIAGRRQWYIKLPKRNPSRDHSRDKKSENRSHQTNSNPDESSVDLQVLFEDR